jgi:pyruvate dehydrogenase E1 component beta subunit
MFEHVQLYALEEDVEDAPVDLDHAAVRRPGSDVSLITYGGSLPRALAAADALATAGIAAEVIDLRTLRPLDIDTLAGSLARTHRAVIVDEGWRTGSLAGEVAAQLGERAFWDLDAPIGRVCSAEVPIPYARHLEIAALPSVDAIVAAAREVLHA